MTDTSLLDEYFPREAQPAPEPQVPKTHIPGFGMAEGVTDSGVPWQPTRQKRKRSGVTPKQLERIGEGLTRDVFKKHGIELEKIPTGTNWAGYPQSFDVDFRSKNMNPQMKVEAKAWWLYKNAFALSRFSTKERAYLNDAQRGGLRPVVSIALLDTEEPSRGNCDALYVIPWGEWLRIEKALAASATGNFKGKSLRRCDIGLLDGFQVVKVNRRWVLPANHWLNEVVR